MFVYRKNVLTNRVKTYRNKKVEIRTPVCFKKQCTICLSYVRVNFLYYTPYLKTI